ncbi:MAG: serine hydrolase domain-containing protein [Anaerolineales bacterium]
MDPELVRFAEAEAARLQVPGLSFGVVHEGRLHTASVGVTNVDHPLPVTAQTAFQIGSTSKTVTATALMLLRERGDIDLEAPVRRYLPQFQLTDEAYADAVTIRHLVTHHAGWDGDYFRDTGRGDDAVGSIVAKLVRSPQLVPPGMAFSYCNSAFYVVAHIVETIAGVPFERFVRDNIFAPLGMAQTTYFPEETLTGRVAAGHIVTTDGPKVASPWYVPRSIAGGGGVISTVDDQLRYAASHLPPGSLGGLEPVLKPESVALMQSELARAGSMCEAVGVSWMLDTMGGERIVKHGGATNGHLSAFELVPARGYACTVLTNSDGGREARETVAAACRKHFLGLEPDPIRPVAMSPSALGAYAGTYRATLALIEVRVEGDGLVAVDVTPGRQFAEQRHQPLPPAPALLVFVGEDRTAIASGPHAGERVEFLRDAAGNVEWLRWDGRLAHRVQALVQARSATHS